MNPTMFALVLCVVVIGIMAYLLATRKKEEEQKIIYRDPRETVGENEFQDQSKSKPCLVLKVIEGLVDGQPKAVVEDIITIGADVSNDIVLNHPTVSGEHAKIVRDDAGQFHIYNRSKTNKVRVNEEKVSSTILNDRDVITLGAVKLQAIAA